MARQLARAGGIEAIVALGCVIRGDTAHFEYVAGECARGLQNVAVETGVPVVFGVLTTETVEQALQRAAPGGSNKGGEAMETALEMADLLVKLGVGHGRVTTRSGLHRAPSRWRASLAMQALYRWQMNDAPWQDLVEGVRYGRGNGSGGWRVLSRARAGRARRA